MDNSETSRMPEVLKDSTPDFVIFQRHGSYQNFPGQGQEVPEEQLGRLTPTGEEEVKVSVQEEARKILDLAKSQGKKINFFVLNSPSPLEDTTGKRYGRRAEDTGRIVAQEIKDIVAKDYQGLEAQMIEFGKTEEGSRPAPKLSEPNYHYVYGSENPTGYKKALVERFGNNDRWEAYHNVLEDLEELRLEVGAESSPDIAGRATSLVKALDRYSSRYGYKSPDSINVYWLTTHNDTLRALVQHRFNAGDRAKGWEPKTGSILELKLQGSTLSTEFAGEELKTQI